MVDSSAVLGSSPVGAVGRASLRKVGLLGPESMKILETIAETGFGRVERVQLKDGTVAARKVFAPKAEITQGVSVEKMRKRFAREVRVQAEQSRSVRQRCRNSSRSVLPRSVGRTGLQQILTLSRLPQHMKIYL